MKTLKEVVVRSGSDDRQPAGSTRDRLVVSALALFAASSFDGVSIRDIERHAGVERGLVAYHFGSKQSLWNEVVDTIFQPYVEEMTALSFALRDVTATERGRALRKAYVRFNARYPQFFRLLVMEGMVRTERTKRLEDHLRRVTALYKDMLGLSDLERVEDLSMMFFILGASATPFILPAFAVPSLNVLGDDIKATDPEFLEPYADMIARVSVRHEKAGEV
ncbi:TetR/AcrR family transcriptional regulator [Rhodococcus sp. MSC1_016]|jgi:TetR/AcrR family transcriptional regulator|uniref:TetR/AcrR family transcriptional regulator n=1 Tax=Rhodococcus sp. MSC1_016 TaxID=2909266 RepID=UPI00202F91E9|nr:TetR family transcriptional regulator [Rhodococcus sp. MSC1_016]